MDAEMFGLPKVVDSIGALKIASDSNNIAIT
jgi:hypothetical protein